MPKKSLQPFVRTPGEGRTYAMGPMTAIFKGDGKETDSTLSISEWWLEPKTEGPHIHQHPEAHIFYVIQGCLKVYLAKRDWFDAEAGTYVYIPGNTDHGFENRSDDQVGFMSINTPGGFEDSLPAIVNYFEQQPLKRLED